MNWNYNASDYDPNKSMGGYELIPIGDHRCRIKDAVEGKTKKEPIRDMITLELEVSGYETTLKHYIVLDPANTQRTNQNLGAVFNGFGIPAGNMNTASWKGKSGGIRVKHETYKGNDGKDHETARVAYLLTPDKTQTLPAWKGNASAPAATTMAPDMMPDLPDLPDEELDPLMAEIEGKLPF